MIRVCSYLWPFTFGVRLGWLTAGHPNPDPAKARDRVFFFRGQAVVLSNGFGTLCGALRRAGYWSEDLRCVGHRWVCRHLTTDPTSGRLIFVGHSAGGRYALYAAQQLESLGITIDLLIGLDVAIPDPVPANIKAGVHLYLSGLRLYPARPFTPAPNSTALIENINLNSPDSPIPSRWLTHLNITDCPAIQAFVAKRILKTLRSA
jgi:hypothetical protein